jgi:hypothetical protein
MEADARTCAGWSGQRDGAPKNLPKYLRKIYGKKYYF